jgi:hypothetical protein
MSDGSLNISTEGYSFTIKDLGFLGSVTGNHQLAGMIADGLADPQTLETFPPLTHIPPYIIDPARGNSGGSSGKQFSRSSSAHPALGNGRASNSNKPAPVADKQKGQLYRFLTQIPTPSAPSSSASSVYVAQCSSSGFVQGSGCEGGNQLSRNQLLAKELLKPQCPQSFAVKCKCSCYHTMYTFLP